MLWNRISHKQGLHKGTGELITATIFILRTPSVILTTKRFQVALFPALLTQQRRSQLVSALFSTGLTGRDSPAAARDSVWADLPSWAPGQETPYSLGEATSAAAEQCKLRHSHYQPQSLSNPMSSKVCQGILSFANDLRNTNQKKPQSILMSRDTNVYEAAASLS